MTDKRTANIAKATNCGNLNKCPICGSATRASEDAFPFCSKRCRQIDLGKWLKGDYLISRPIEQSDLDEGE